MIDSIPYTVAFLAVLVAVVTDLRYYRIHNLLTVPLFLSGLAYNLIESGWWGFAASAVGAATGFATLVGLYLIGGMGAGDVKMMAGLGAWLGPAMISDLLLASCVAAGLYALGLLIFNQIWRSRSAEGRSAEGPSAEGTSDRWSVYRLWGRADGDRLVELAESPTRRRRLIPFGLAILAGLLAMLARDHLYL